MKETYKKISALAIVLTILVCSFSLSASAVNKEMDSEVTVNLYTITDGYSPDDKYTESIDGSSPIDINGNKNGASVNTINKNPSETVDYIIDEKGKLPATGSNNLMMTALLGFSGAFLLLYFKSGKSNKSEVENEL